MTDSSPRPSAPLPRPPVHPAWHEAEPFPPPPPTERRTVPSPSGTTLMLIVAGAVMSNLAIQGRAASAAGWCSALLAGAVILSSARRRTASAIFTVVLAATVSTNLVLRASTWVTGPVIIATVSLLLLASLDELTSLRLANIGDQIAAVLEASLRSISHLASPMKRWLGPANAERAAVLRGLVVGAVVATVLTLLLANADAVVGGLLGDSLSSSIWTHLLLSGLCAVAFGTGSLLSLRTAADLGERSVPTPRPIEALMGLGAMALVLAGWVAIQLTIALGGAERLLATAGLTRSDYAREGFFELVAVVAVVLSMLALFGGMLGRPARTRTLSARLLILTVGGLGVILVGVTFSRLTLYIDAFGLTMLRLSVAWFLGWLCFLVLVVTANVSGVGEERAWLPAGVIISAAIVVTLFGWSNPEATVASTNLERGREAIDVDLDYLNELGPDAAAVLEASGMPPTTACLADDVQPFGPFGWNRSWAKAC